MDPMNPAPQLIKRSHRLSFPSTSPSQRAARVRVLHRHGDNEPLLAELIDRSDVVFHFAAAVASS